jgi:hypothetical protein
MARYFVPSMHWTHRALYWHHTKHKPTVPLRLGSPTPVARDPVSGEDDAAVHDPNSAAFWSTQALWLMSEILTFQPAFAAGPARRRWGRLGNLRAMPHENVLGP